MKKLLVVIAILFFTVSSAQFATPGFASREDRPFAVERLVIAGSIEDREPVGVVSVFSVSTEKVYCFLEAKGIKEDTSVNFVWYAGDKKMATVSLPLKKSSRWRTYSSKKLGGLKGEWTVELQDSDGSIIKSVAFSVE